MPTVSVLRRAATCVALLGTLFPAFAQAVGPAPQIPFAPPDSVRSRSTSSAAPLGESIRFRGAVFMDYSVLLASPEADMAGANSFDYRRVRLTADYDLSEAISGRVRFEGSGTSTTERGNPSPYIKEVWLHREGPLAEGHSFTLGVQPPPLFDFSESIWGYRSLEGTVMDRVRANSSRDLGFRADGPLAPAAGLSYSVMVGDGRGIRAEDDGDRAKRVYAQVQARSTQTLHASIGGDYSPYEAGDEEMRDRALKASLFVGARTNSFRGGVDAFSVRTDFVDDAQEQTTGMGGSVFGAASFGDDGQYRAIGRLDYVEAEVGRADEPETYLLIGGGYAPIPALEILPNVLVSTFRDQDPEVTARITVHARF